MRDLGIEDSGSLGCRDFRFLDMFPCAFEEFVRYTVPFTLNPVPRLCEDPGVPCMIRILDAGVEGFRAEGFRV